MLRYLLLVVALVAIARCHTLEKRMIRAFPTDIKEYPYLVFVGTGAGNICNGAIIAKKYVLTAAHCVTHPMDDIVIVAGSNSRTGDIHSSFHRVENVTLHPNYSVDDQQHRSIDDVAVVKVVEPFVYDRTRQPIKLAKSGQSLKINTKAKAAGFGKTEFGYLDEFFKLDFYIADKENCNKSYASWGGILPGQFCATTKNQKLHYFCNGDSGSPLVVRHRVVGITIYGMGCELEDTPGVYTDVGYFREWIDKHVVYDHQEKHQRNLVVKSRKLSPPKKEEVPEDEVNMTVNDIKDYVKTLFKQYVKKFKDYLKLANDAVQINNIL